MKTRTLAKLIVGGGIALVCFGILELAVRLKTVRDEDGNCKFHNTWLKPLHVPVHKADKIIADYLASKDSAKMYDSELGWTQRPNVQNHNAAGFIATHPDVAEERPSDRLRIAVFGGSYTEGTFDHGWWRVLEESLNEAGIKAEVLNFGVAGYGMDQAYLRWKRDGIRYHPDIVMFGLCIGNAYDNLNMVRVVKDVQTGLALTKPRFILENGSLRLLNVPTPPPEQIPAFLRRLTEWPLLQYEHFYQPADFAMKPWRHSRLLALAEAKLGGSQEQYWGADFYRLGHEPAELSLAIVRQFAREVQASGSVFCMAHVPHYSDLGQLRETGKFQSQDLINAMDQIAPIAHTEHALLDACKGRPIEASFVESHYSPPMHAVVGKEISKFVQQHAEAWRHRQ